MKLYEAIVPTGNANKQVVAPIPGVHTVRKARSASGYYSDFIPDDSGQRNPVKSSRFWGEDYPGADPLAMIASFAGEDGWEPHRDSPLL